ncbi:MAG: hypothetical protein IKX68_04040 [Clostridiales bacterium]|nr:hypothetical protein [Clostridiales bacterium]
MKKHTCPTCAGQLRINTELQIYECPFCGVTYDYEYFREDDVLERAERSMKAGEYNSAAEAYDFMLAKEPHNFIALRGKVMIAANAKSMQEFRDPNRLRTLNFSKMDQEIDQAIFASESKGRDYFSKLKELVAAGKEYREVIMSITKSRNQRKLEVKKIQQFKRAQTNSYVDIGDKKTEVSVHPKDMMVAAIVIYIVWCILVGIMAISLTSGDTTKVETTKKSGYSFDYRYVVGINGDGTNDPYVYNYLYQDFTSDQKKELNSASQEVNRNYEEIWGEIVQEATDDNTSTKKSSKKSSKEKEEDTTKKKESKSGLWGLLIALIVLPGIGCAGYCFYLKRKLNEIDKIENTIRVYRERASEAADQILDHESDAVSVRKKISLLYKELTELDPAPDIQNMPIERGPGISRRWQ